MKKKLAQANSKKMTEKLAPFQIRVRDIDCNGQATHVVGSAICVVLPEIAEASIEFQYPRELFKINEGEEITITIFPSQPVAPLSVTSLLLGGRVIESSQAVWIISCGGLMFKYKNPRVLLKKNIRVYILFEKHVPSIE